MSLGPEDIPDIGFKKPHELEVLEKLPHSILNAMAGVEIDEKIQDAAESIAKEYHHVQGERGSLSECILLVSGALTQTGKSIDGKLGMEMVGKSEDAAQRACQIFYPEHPSPNELEY